MTHYWRYRIVSEGIRCTFYRVPQMGYEAVLTLYKNKGITYAIVAQEGYAHRKLKQRKLSYLFKPTIDY